MSYLDSWINSIIRENLIVYDICNLEYQFEHFEVVLVIVVYFLSNFKIIYILQYLDFSSNELVIFSCCPFQLKLEGVDVDEEDTISEPELLNEVISKNLRSTQSELFSSMRAFGFFVL